MKKIEAITRGRKFTEKLLGLKKRSINRALDGAKDDLEAQKENAVIDYENLLTSLADDKVDYKEVINDMIEKQQIIQDSISTIELIDSIKSDLESEVEE